MKKAKEKKVVSKKKIIIISSICAALVLGAGIPLTIALTKDKSTQKEEINDNQTEIMERPTDGTTPKDHSILDNIKIAAGVIYNNPHFRTVSEGHALTTMVIQNDQFVHTERFVDGRDNSMTNYYTYSSFKTEAFQRYYGKDRMFIRKGSVNKNTNVVTYNPGDPNIYDLDYARQNIGWFPYQMTSYIFSEETILEAEVIESDTYDYYVKLVLDTEVSISQTKREVRLNGGAISYPTYDKVEVSIGMDKDWVVREIHNEETYWLDVKMGVTLHAPADTNMTEYFYYDNYKIGEEEIAYYSKYANVTISDPVIEEKEKTPTDYLMDSMLGLVLDGGSLDINGFVGDYETTGKIFVKFDITSMDANVIGLFDDLYFKYDGDMKISYRKHNYEWDSSFFEYILDALNVDLDSIIDSITSGDSLPTEGESEDNGLLSQLTEIKMDVVENDDKTKDIKLSGGLDADGTKVDYVISVIEDEYGSLLKSIEVKAIVDEKEVNLKIEPSLDDNFDFSEPTYVNLSETTWVVDEIINISKYEGYNIESNYDYNDYKVRMNAKLDKNNHAYVTTTIDKVDSTKEPVDVNIYYYEDNAYIMFGGIKVKATSTDIKDIIDQVSILVSSYFEEDDTNTDINVSNDDISKILNTTYEVFDGINVNEKNDIIMSIAVSTLFSDIEDAKVVMSHDENGLVFEVNPYNFKMLVKETKDIVSIKEDDTYLTRKEFDKTVDYALSLYDMTKEDIVRIDFGNVNVNIKDELYTVNGYLLKLNDAYEARLTLNGKYDGYLDLIYQDDMYYLSLDVENTNVKVKFTSEEFNKFLKDVEEGSYSLIEDYKVREYVDELVIKYKEELMSKDVNIDEIIEYIYIGLLESDNIEVNYKENDVTLIYKKDYSASFTKTELGFTFELDKVSYEGVEVSGNIGIVNEGTISTYDIDDYVNIDKVLNALDQIIVEFNNSNLTIEDIKEMVNDVSNYNGYNIVINTTYEEYKALITLNVTKDYKIKGTISLTKDDKEPISFDLYYVDDKVYFEYGNIALVVTQDDILDIEALLKEYNLISDSSSLIPELETQEIIDKVFDIYKGITITEDNKIDIALLLSALNDNVKDITLRLYYKDNIIHVDVPEYDTYINISNYNEVTDDFTLDNNYLTRSELDTLITYYHDIEDLVKSNAYTLNLDNIEVNYNDVTYKVNAEIRVNDKDLLVNASVSFKDYDIKVKLTKLNDNYYLSVNVNDESYSIVASEENILKLISDTISNRKGLVTDSEFNDFKDYIIEKLDIDLDKKYEVNEIIDKVYPYILNVKDAEILVSEGSYKLAYNENEVTLNKEDNVYKLNVLGKYEDINVKGTILLNSNVETISLDETKYINVDKVITILNDSLNEISLSSYTLYDLYLIGSDLVALENYNINLTYSYKEYSINVDALVLSSLDVNAHVIISKTNESDIELDITYLNETVYVTYGNINLLVTKDDINDIIEFVLPLIKVEEPSYSSDIEDILNKVTHILSSFTIDEEGNFHIGLLLDEVLEELNEEISIDLSYNKINKEVTISNTKYDVLIKVSGGENSISLDETKVYLTRSDYDNTYSNIEEITNIINSKKFEVTINNIEVEYENNTYKVSGKLIVNDDLLISLNIDYNDTNALIDIRRVNKVYYVNVTYKEQVYSISSSEENDLKLINDIISNRSGLVTDDEFNDFISYLLDTFGIDLDKTYTVEEILDMVYPYVVNSKDASIVSSNNGITVTYENYSFSLLNNESVYSINLDSEIAKANISIKASEEIINVDTSKEYVNIDKVVNILNNSLNEISLSSYTLYDLYQIALDLVEFENYGIDIAYRYEDYVISVDAVLLNNLNVKAHVNISKVGEEPIDLDIIYLNDKIYLTIGDNNVVISKDDITDIIALISPSLGDKTIDSNIDYNEMISKVDHILSSFTIDTDGNFHIGLLLDEIIEVIDEEIVIDVSYNKETKVLTVSNVDYDVVISVSKATSTVSIDETKTYLSRIDFDNIYSKVNEILDLINSKKFETTINNLKVTYEGDEYNVDVNAIVNNDTYYLDLKMTGKVNVDVSLYLLDEYYYVSFKYDDLEQIDVRLNKESVLLIINNIIENRDIFLGELTIEEYIEKYIGELPSKDEISTSDFDLLDLYRGLVEVTNAKVSVEGNNLTLSYSDILVKFVNDETTHSLNIDVKDYEGVSVIGDITLKELGTLPVIDESKYYDASRIEETILELIDTVVANNWSIEDAINTCKELMDYEGYLITLNKVSVEKIIVSGTIKLDKDLNIEMNLSISYDTKNTNIKVYKIGDDYYVVWENYNFFINKEDLEEVISTISGDSEEVTSIYDTIDMIMGLFSNINGENNAFNISLALSKLYKELDDTDVTITYSNGIYVTSSKNNIEVSVTNLTTPIVDPNIDKLTCFNRTDLDVVLDYVDGIMSYINEGKASLTIDKDNPINIKLGSLDLIVNGHINFKMVDDGSEEKKVTFSAEIYLTGSMHYYFALQYNLQEELYISFSVDWDETTGEVLTPMVLKFTRDDIIKILKVVLNNIDEDSEIGKTMDNFDTLNQIKQLIVASGLIDKDEMKPEKVEQTIGDIAPIVFGVLDFLKGSTFDIRDDKSIHLEKDYIIDTDGEDIETSTNIDLLQVENGENIDYVVTISKLELGSISINGGFTISRFEDDVTFEITDAIDMHGLDLLGEGLFNSINNMKFFIEGQLTMTLLSIYNVNVEMDARVKYVDGEIEGYIHFKVPYVLAAINSTGGADSYIFFTKDTIYMRKDAKSNGFLGLGAKTTTTFRQNTYGEFVDNIVDNIVYLLDLTDLIAKAFESDTEFNITEDKLLKSYTYNESASTYAFDFDLKNGLGTTMFNEDLIMTVGTGTYENESYLKSFTGTVKMFSVIALKFDFEEKACFGSEVVFDETLITTLRNQSL